MTIEYRPRGVCSQLMRVTVENGIVRDVQVIGGCNGNPRIHIDMFWGKPRLNISLPDKTFACLTYEASALSEAQAFGPAGLELAAEVKKQIDSLLD